MLPGFVPKYFSSEWSCAQIRGVESKSICSFDRDSLKIYVVCADGTFITYNFENKQGECVRLSSKRFVKDPGEIPENVITNTTQAMSASEGGSSNINNNQNSAGISSSK